MTKKELEAEVVRLRAQVAVLNEALTHSLRASTASHFPTPPPITSLLLPFESRVTKVD